MIKVTHQRVESDVAITKPVELETFKFPGGEIGIKIPLGPQQSGTENFVVRAWLNNSDDIMELFMVFDAIRRQRVQPKISLFIGYMPYARQDRVCVEGEALSIAVMAKLINSLNATHVMVVDPHSNVMEPLIENCRVIRQRDIVKSCLSGLLDRYGDAPEIDLTDWWLLAPDNGARKEVEALASMVKARGVIYADKTRDLATGKIIKTEIHIPDDFRYDKVMIIDDICDGGRTFIEIAKALCSKVDVDSLGLFVTHGIFSKGLDELYQHFDYVYTTNSYHANTSGHTRPDGSVDQHAKYFAYEII